MTLQEKHIVAPLLAPTRLSDLPAGTFITVHSRKAFKKLLKNGFVTLNGALAQTANFVSGNELIEIYSNDVINSKMNVVIPLEVLFEDDYLAVINKPAGIEVSGNKKYTITNALANALAPSTQIDALAKPLPAHRLDYPTNGCLVIGKTTKTLIALNQLFEHQKIDKTYLAVTINSQKATGVIEEPIDGKPSISTFKVVRSISSQKYEALNLVALKPKTGRRHQLRKHQVFIGNPIFGEKEYGNPTKQGRGNGLYLQAYKLKFKHPVTEKELLITSPISKKIRTLFPNIEEILKRDLF